MVAHFAKGSIGGGRARLKGHVRLHRIDPLASAFGHVGLCIREGHVQLVGWLVGLPSFILAPGFKGLDSQAPGCQEGICSHASAILGVSPASPGFEGLDSLAPGCQAGIYYHASAILDV